MKELPFKIKSNSEFTFTEQIVRGTIGAVRSGYYAIGDKLPTFLEISEQLGVSVMVVRNAFKQLALKGVVNVNRRLGIVVPEKEHGETQKHILFISYGLGPSFYFASITDSFVRTLNDNKCRVTTVSPSQSQTIADILDTQHVNMAIVDTTEPGPMFEMLLARNIPFVHAFPQSIEHVAPGAVASAVMDMLPSYRAMAKHCEASGIRNALVCCQASESPLIRNLLDVFDEKNIKHSFIKMGSDAEPAGRQDGVNLMELKGYRSIRRLLGSGARLPDLLLSMDDFFTRGMLAAIQEEKLDVPKDLQIISLVNRGNIPVWRSHLTRIEHTPEKYGRLLADACLRWFAKRRIYKPMLLRPRFVVGGTTWRKRRIR